MEEEIKVNKQELKLERLKKIEQEEQKVENYLHTVQYADLISDKYKMMRAYVDMVVKNISISAIIAGKGGVGKTFNCISIANKAGVKFKYINNFATPQALYIKAYEYKDEELVFLDDVSSLMDCEKNLSLLKALTWDSVGKGLREVSYETTKPMTDMYGMEVPRKFFTKCRYVIIVNSMPTSKKLKPHIDAILSRTNYTFVDLTNKDLEPIFEQIVEKDYNGLTKEERQEVFDYLKTQMTVSLNDLDLRTIFKMFNFKRYSNEIHSPHLWKQLSLNILKKDETLVIVETLLKDDNFNSEEERVAKFTELTGMQKSRYYELRNKIKNNES